MEDNISKVESPTNLKMLKYYSWVPKKYKVKFEKNIERLVRTQDNKFLKKRIVLDNEWVHFLKDTYRRNLDMYMQKKCFYCILI